MSIEEEVKIIRSMVNVLKNILVGVLLYLLDGFLVCLAEKIFDRC